MARISSRSVNALRALIETQLALDVSRDDLDGEIVLLRQDEMGTLAAACCYPPLPDVLAAAMAWTPVDMRAAFQLTFLLEAIVKATRSLPEERWQAGDITSIEVIFMFKSAYRPTQSLYKGRQNCNP